MFVDTGELAVASEFARLVGLAERLRGPGGCPWDAKQTHHSLRRHVLEEAYEVAEAIEDLPPDAPGGEVDVERYDALEDELGDLLFQVVIQSVLAAEAGAFTIADVARRIHDKLVRRHPHVFGEVRVSGADEVVTNWEQIKRTETGSESIVAGVTAGLPSLLAVQKLLRKADAFALDPGLAPPDLGDDEAVGRALATIVAAGKARRHRRGVRPRGMGPPLPRSLPTHGGTRARTRHRSLGRGPRGHQRAVERGLSTPIRSAPSYA